MIKVSIGGGGARALLDTGATGNFMSPNWAAKWKVPLRQKQQPYSLGALGDGDLGEVTKETHQLGMSMDMRHWEKTKFDIVNLGDNYDVVLGHPWFKQHNPDIDWRRGIVRQWRCECPRPTTQLPDQRIGKKQAGGRAPNKEKIWATKESTGWEKQKPDSSTGASDAVLPEEYQEFEALFKDITTSQALPEYSKWDHEIPLQEGKLPVCLPIYRMTEQEQEALRKYLEDNLKKGYIRPSSSPAGAPIIWVPKKDGSLRMCVDYRRLNEITIKNRYPLPLIDEIQDKFIGTTWFSTFDVRDGYYRIRMKQGEEWKTAFRTKYGLYEYLVMPFGLTNAPATFQTMMNEILQEYLDDFVIAYLDDVVVFTKGSKKEHTEKVRLVLKRLQEHNLLLKLKKCEFFKKEVRFLGHIVSTEGLQMDPDKIKAIQDWPIPTTVKEVQAFHGLANYYRQFIKGFSAEAAPLTRIFKKDQEFKWGPQEQQAFDKIKELFAKGEMRAHFDPAKQSVVDTDASDCAIGARLQQADNQGRMKLISCFARKMTPAEQNYDIHDKELLAIIEALRKWRSYLQGARHKVVILSDHRNLQFFTTSKEFTRRQARWYDKIKEYDIIIKYCKGTENSWADALSRRPDLMEKSNEKATLFRNTKDGMVLQKQTLNATIVEAPEPAIWEKIREAQKQDTYAHNISKETGQLVTINGLVYVPRSMRNEVMKLNHDAPSAGHFGIDKTVERVTRTYYWPGIWQTVRRYIGECEMCQRNKAERHPPYGQLQPIPTLRKPWETITMDFIVKLPKSKEPGNDTVYDAILPITDKLTKYAYFIPFKESTNAPDTAHVVMRNVFSNHGTPKEIITDRDPKFTSKFWTTMMEKLGVDHKLSTAYHPQTDGQTERLNQTLEQYLRNYVNYDQKNWAELLPIAQYAYNSAKHTTTGMSPFFANYGMEPDITQAPIECTTKAPEAEERVKRLTILHEQLQRDIEFYGEKMKKHYDLGRQEAPAFREGEKVFLLRRNIKTKRPSEKLEHRKLGPFKIESQVSPVNYRLTLPKTMKVYPVFHVALLEKAPQNAKEKKTEVEEEQEYEVEEILNRRRSEGRTEYLVKWKGYPTSENTWEPIAHLQGCQQELQRFKKKGRPTGQEREMSGKTSQR